MVVDGEKIEHIARLAAASCCERFVGCNVDDVEHITELVIPNGREEAEIAVTCPFQSRTLPLALDQRTVDARLAPQPFNDEIFPSQQISIGRGRGGDSFSSRS